GECIVEAEVLTTDGGAALAIEQHFVHGVADLTGKQPKTIEGRFPGTGGKSRVQRGARVTNVRPVTLTFQTEHKLTRLPAIADLPADQTAAGILATFSEDIADTVDGGDIDALSAPTISAVRADIQPGPIIHHRRYDRRRLIGCWRQIRRARHTTGQNG